MTVTCKACSAPALRMLHLRYHGNRTSCIQRKARQKSLPTLRSKNNYKDSVSNNKNFIEKIVRHVEQAAGIEKCHLMVWVQWRSWHTETARLHLVKFLHLIGGNWKLRRKHSWYVENIFIYIEKMISKSAKAKLRNPYNHQNLQPFNIAFSKLHFWIILFPLLLIGNFLKKVASEIL